MSNSPSFSKKFFLFLTIAFGCAYHTIHLNFQAWLATGDHGLVLYGAEKILEGQRPYHDFHYFYGPLMLYYYALWMKWLGIHLSSVLMGQTLLSIVTGTMLYQSLARFVRPAIGFFAAACFWLYGKTFFYTYNHIGIVALSAILFYLCVSYIDTPRRRYVYGGLICAVLAGLIKLNFGIVMSLELILSVLIAQLLVHRQAFSKDNIILYIHGIVSVPLLIMGLSWLTVRGLPFHVIRQCYQYFGNDATVDEYPSIPENIIFLVREISGRLQLEWITLVVAGGILILVIAQMIGQRSTSNHHHPNRNSIWCAWLITAIFLVGQCHEFILSGVYFRSFFSEPFYMILLGLSIGFMAQRAPAYLRRTVVGGLIAAAAAQLFITHLEVKHLRKPWQRLKFDRADVTIKNNPRWMYTVLNTIKFVNDHIPPDEAILFAPYDPLYYFLLDRDSPTRQLVFFEFTAIPDTQQQDIIRELNESRTQWIVLSNRIHSDDRGEGIFGTSHSRLIKRYLDDHFELVKTIGDWDKDYQWTDTCAVKILRRRAQ